MKTVSILLFFLAFINGPETPDGIWVYKQDSSRIEINTFNGKLSGKLISTKNPGKRIGTLILKEFTFQDGKWQGQLYMATKDRWVEANLEQKQDLILIHLDLGYEIRSMHLYKGN